MKKNIVILLVVLLLVLSLTSIVMAQDNSPNGVTQVSTWTLSPNPAAVNGTLTTNIAFTFLSTDTTTQFCIEGPANAGDSASNWYAIMPATINLNLSQGFASETVAFSKNTLDNSQTICPGGTYVALYSGTHTSTLATGTSIDVTTSVGTPFNLATSGNTATAGTGNWTLVLEEPSGVPGSIGYALQLNAAQTPNTGLSGRVIDSKTLLPWVYGAEIQIIQTTGANVGIKGSTFVILGDTVPGDPSQDDGKWAITFGTTDDLGLCPVGGCKVGNEYATYQVRINYTCNLNAVHTRPAFNSSTDANCPIQINGVNMTGVPINYEFTVTDSATGALVALGDAETNRGPTAVNLLDVNITQNQTTQVVGIAIVFLGLVFTSILVWRRKIDS